MLRTHVLRGPDQAAKEGKEGLFGEFDANGFGHSKVDDFGAGRSVVIGVDENIAGFEIPVNNAFLMGVLNSVANLFEELKSSIDGKLILVTEFGERESFHQLHRKERPAKSSGARIVDLCDVWVVHQGESLSFSLKAGHDFA